MIILTMTSLHGNTHLQDGFCEQSNRGVEMISELQEKHT